MDSENTDSTVTEVSIDSAINSSLSDTSWLDAIITNTITAKQDCKENITVEMLSLRILADDKDFLERNPSLSVVECFKYLFINLEKITQNVDTISEENLRAIETCSRDLAASFLRMSGKELELKILVSPCGDDAVAFQAQCDESYVMAIKGNSQEFQTSILKEVEILLKLENVEEAYLKILKYKLYTEGLEKLSNHIRSAELSRFDMLFSLRKRMYEKFLDFMDDEGGSFEHEVLEDRASATILVDVNGSRGYKDGKFHVQDLASALKLAQNGGIIFLENGNYTSDSFFYIKQKSSQKAIDIIGASTNDCSIHGTIKIEAEHKVRFKRIKFEVGDAPESNDAIYILGGQVVFSNCLLEATVNTLWYLIGKKSSNISLTVQHCVVDGLESCQRAVTFQGQNVSVVLDHSLFRDMFSVLTVLDIVGSDTIENVSVVMIGCEVDDVQTGVVLSLDRGDFSCDISCCKFNLVLYDQEGAKAAVEVLGGHSVGASNNHIHFKHVDGKGFSACDVNQVDLTRNVIESTSEVDRKLAVAEAIVAENVERLVLKKIHINGFRIGVRIKQTQTALISNSLMECCSVGIFVMKSRHHKKVEVSDSIFKTMYYGVMGEDPGTALTLRGVQFIDIPKALLLCKELIKNLTEENCAYLLSREYTSSCQSTTLESEMNLYLATSENLPHRVAYEREDVQLVFKFGDLGFME